MKLKPGLNAYGRVKIELINPPVFNNDFNTQVDEIWKSETDKNPYLFDGKVLCFDSYENINGLIQVKAYFFNYRYVVAKNVLTFRAPDITVIGTSGVCLITENETEYLVTATRSESNFLAPGKIEMVPSGVVDDRSFNQNGELVPEINLFNEFEEETGLDKSFIQSFGKWYFIHDTNTMSVDFCAELVLGCTINQMRASLSKSDEYENPVFIEKKQLKNYININTGKMTLLTRCFLEQLLYPE